MKAVSQTYKDNIKQIGREITYEVTYTNNGTTTTLGDADILNANMHYEGGILKSVMKQLDIELYNDLAIGTELTYKFGVKTREGKNLCDGLFRQGNTIDTTINNRLFTKNDILGKSGKTYTISTNLNTDNFKYAINVSSTPHPSTNFYDSGWKTTSSFTFTLSQDGYIGVIISKNGNAVTPNDIKDYWWQIEEGSTATEYEEYGMYDYIDYGKFIVYSSEKLEDSNTYKLVCYDKMLYAMKDYEALKGKNLYDASYRNVNNAIYCVNGTATESNGVFTLTATGTDLYMWQIRNSGTAYDKNFAGDIYAFDKDEYTISTTNQTIKANYITFYDENKVSLGYIGFGGVGYQRTIKKGVNNVPSNAKYFSLRFGFNQAVVGQTYSFSVLVEEGNTATNYVPYFEYPTTIRTYATILADNIGLKFANADDEFTNYDKTIANELYIDTDGNSIGYTYRDVLDEIAQATASTICINDNDELEIRYITNASEEKTSISGTSFNMTTRDNKVDIDLLGNTTQNTTTGKNLLGLTKNQSVTINGVTLSITEDGFVKLNGTATSDINKSYNWATDGIAYSSTAYTYSMNYVSGSITYTSHYAYINVRGGATPSSVSIQFNSPNLSIKTENNITFTPSGTGYITGIQLMAQSGIVFNNYIIKLQVEKGSTKTSYEPYTGGIASPNPNYPQSIETTTGRNTIEICGKNIANWMQGNVNSSGVYSSTNLAICTDYISANNGDTFTAQKNTAFENNNDNMMARLFDKNKNIIASTTALSKGLTTQTITLNNSNVAYVRFAQYRTAGLLVDNNYQIMVEKGSTKSTYEPYIGNSYEVNLGKNLLSLIDGTYSSNSVIAIVNNGQITTNGTANGTSFIGLIYPLDLKAGTYTISANNLVAYSNANVDIRVTDNAGSTLYARNYLNTTNAKLTFTLNTDLTNGRLQLRTGNGETLNNFIFKPQLEKGTQATSYSPYFTPIELCKIGTYQDRLFKASGKNLFNKDDTNNTNGYLKNDGTIQTNSSFTTSDYIDVSQYSNITISGNSGSSELNCFYDSNKTYLSSFGTGSLTTITQSVPNNARYIRVTIKNTSLNNYMLQSGSSATTYEPYGKNEWWLKKTIGKVVLNGSETWYYRNDISNTNTYCFRSNAGIIQNIANLQPIYSNNFRCLNNTNDEEHFRYSANVDGYALQLFINKTRVADTNPSSLQTWLSNNNTIVYYVLATPTYTKIENDELIGQLEHIRLINGYNNVISSLPITLDYVSGIDTIDGEYLKDINVNFGEEVKPINTITLKRSGDTDVISLSYPEDLENDKKNEIAISENQILNGDNRDTFMQPILDKLYGLTYCLNDYTSTGITYYDLCDRYEVSITRTDVDGNTLETNFYPCIMFNDEINVNQGLQETIHTDRPEESVTDYNTTTKSDRLQTRTDLIVNKQEGYIEAITGELGMDEDGNSVVLNGIRQYQDKNSAIIEAISSTDTTIDENGNVVPTGVKTITGFTFDKEGLKISSTDNTYRTRIDETGTFYYDGDTELGRTTNEGSAFKNMELYGEFRYGKDEYGETSMFVGMLFKETNNNVEEECFGHFYNGRE